MYVNPRDLFVSSLLIRDLKYEEFESSLLERMLAPGAVFVDVGAQIGYYTSLAAMACGDAGCVYAFEPNITNFRILLKNIELNKFANVVVCQKAVSKEESHSLLYIDSFNLGKHSLSENNVTAIDELEGVQPVETTSLDWFMRSVGQKRVDVLKIDAEGAEGLVIDGALGLLAEHDVTIFMEVWPFGQRNLGTDPDVMLSKLDALGYTCWLIDETTDRLRKLEDRNEVCKGNEPRRSFNLLLRKIS